MMLLITYKANSQGLYKDKEIYNLIISGKTKMKVYVNESLKAVWFFDSSQNTAEEWILKYKFLNPTAPSYNDRLTVRAKIKYFFLEKGAIDSTIRVLYNFISENRNDTDIVKYNYPQLDNRVMNRKMYSLKNGEYKWSQTDYFGYDEEKRLILLIQDEGRTQFYYTLNQQGQIIQENIYDTTIYYSYNGYGKIAHRVAESLDIKYDYNSESLLIRKISTTGTDTEITTYAYE